MTNFVQKSIVKTADLVIFCNLWRLRNNQVLWTNQKSFTEKWHNVMTCLVMVFSYVANYSRNVFKSALNQSTLILIIFILEVHFDQKCFHIAICRFFLVSGIAKTHSYLLAVMAHLKNGPFMKFSSIPSQMVNYKRAIVTLVGEP